MFSDKPKYWAVYQYSANLTPHVFITEDRDEMDRFLDEVPAQVIASGKADR